MNSFRVLYFICNVLELYDCLLFSERILRHRSRLCSVRHRVVRQGDAAQHERHLLEGLQRLLALRLRQLQQGHHWRKPADRTAPHLNLSHIFDEIFSTVLTVFV